MNPNEDEKLDRILAEVDFKETDDEPRLSPDLETAVVTPTAVASSTQEMALSEERGRETQPGEASCQGPSLSFSLKVYGK